MRRWAHAALVGYAFSGGLLALDLEGKDDQRSTSAASQRVTARVRLGRSPVAGSITRWHIHHTVIEGSTCRPGFHEFFAASAISLRRVAFASPFKAVRELAALSLDADDAVDVLRSLSSADAHGRLQSEPTNEWMHVFEPKVGEMAIYVKVAVRDDCIVVSFHEDEADHDDSA